MTAPEAAPSLLDGIRVLDIATYIAGPAAATIMADFGAEVIKVEAPSGDPYRYLGGMPGYPQSPHNFSWMVDARGKRSITLDLTSAGGQEILHRLVAETDVLVTNFPLPVRARLGLRYADLRGLNERLIYASLTAYGETGPEADRPGFDSTAWWARSGLMDLVKPAPEGPPARSIPGMGDHPTALALYGAILTALYRRERTGAGAHVATSLMASGLWSNAIYAQAAFSGAEIVPRPAREDMPNALTNTYRCRDGHWFMLSMVNEARYWAPFCQAVERADLIEDARFAKLADRHANARALIDLLDKVFSERDWVEWLPRIRAAGIPFGVVNRTSDLADDEQMRAGGAIVSYAEPIEGIADTVASPIWVSDSGKRPPGPAPDLGAHTDEVLGEIGYDATEIETLRQAGALG